MHEEHYNGLSSLKLGPPKQKTQSKMKSRHFSEIQMASKYMKKNFSTVDHREMEIKMASVSLTPARMATTKKSNNNK